MVSQAFSQSKLDSLLESTQPKVSSYDYRRSAVFDRTTTGGLERLHRAFCRDLSRRLGPLLQVNAQVEPVSIDETSFESYARSLPTPAMVGLVDLDSSMGRIVVDIDSHLGFAILDILLGGHGRSSPVRGLTELETALLGDVLDHVAGAVGAAFDNVRKLEPKIVAVQSVPNLAQVAVPAEPCLVLTFSAIVSAATKTVGNVTICYPRPILEPLVEAISAGAGLDVDPDMKALPTGEAAPGPLSDALLAVGMPIVAHFEKVPLTLGEFSMLQPGDVLRLDHEVDEPITASAGDVPLFKGELGRHRDNIAIRVTEWNELL